MKKVVNGIFVDTDLLEEVLTWEDNCHVDFNIRKYRDMFGSWSPTFSFRLYRNPSDHDEFLVVASNGYCSPESAVSFIGKEVALWLYQNHVSPYMGTGTLEKWFGPFERFVEDPVAEEAPQC